MRIGGLTRSTALDFPGGLISAVVFTQGCDFTCPYCHNPQLVRMFGEPVEEEMVLEFLKKRKGLLDGVVISGGEPTLQPTLSDFCKKAIGLGYAVKLDTNGGHPEVMADLIERKLVHYVAMDIKSDPKNYSPDLSPKDLGNTIIESINILKRSVINYEFRTTVVEPYVTLEKIIPMAKAIAGNAPFYLQRFRPGKILKPEIIDGHQPNAQELEMMRILAQNFVPTFIR